MAVRYVAVDFNLYTPPRTAGGRQPYGVAAFFATSKGSVSTSPGAGAPCQDRPVPKGVRRRPSPCPTCA